jgi:hypothetical protein
MSKPYTPQWPWKATSRPSPAPVGGARDGVTHHLAAGFLTRVQAEYGLPVSQGAMDLTQLVISELVTNARKYAPGPVLMDLRSAGDAVEAVVWDCDPVLPLGSVSLVSVGSR